MTSSAWMIAWGPPWVPFDTLRNWFCFLIDHPKLIEIYKCAPKLLAEQLTSKHINWIGTSFFLLLGIPHSAPTISHVRYLFSLQSGGNFVLLWLLVGMCIEEPIWHCGEFSMDSMNDHDDHSELLFATHCEHVSGGTKRVYSMFSCLAILLYWTLLCLGLRHPKLADPGSVVEQQPNEQFTCRDSFINTQVHSYSIL